MYTPEFDASRDAPLLVLDAVAELELRYEGGEVDLRTYLDELARHADSLVGPERAEVIRLMGGIPHVDAARELMRLYHACEWRTTRLQIIQALSRFSFQRSVEFLIGLVATPTDLPICEAAIWSLGQTRQPFAARFLVALYRHGPPVFRAAVVGALGRATDRSLVDELVEELPRALAANDCVLVKQLALTLAELKVASAVPGLSVVLRRSGDPDVRTSALIALGRLARNPAILDGFEGAFRADPLGVQLFASARSQCQFRSQWQIEDYLAKLFGDTTCHPMLPFELNTFPEDDVEAGFDLYGERRHLRTRVAALAGLGHPRRFEWYAAVAAVADLDDAEVRALLASLGHQCDERALDVLTRLEARCLACTALFEAWVEALSLAVPRADVEFRRLMSGPAWSTWSAPLRIVVINHLANLALAQQPDARLSRRIGADLEAALVRESDTRVQGRLVRAVAQARYTGPKVVAWVAANLHRPEVAPSCLVYLERVAPRTGVELLLAAADDPRVARPFARGLLAAFATQPAELPRERGALDRLLTFALGPTADADQQLAALHCLARYPSRAYTPRVVGFLSDRERLHVAAILALKSIASPDTVEVLAAGLSSASDSIVGRTIDALAAIGGATAARVLLAFIGEHPADLELCDKVIRALQPPASGRETLVEMVDAILRAHPAHPLGEGLYGLRERLTARLEADAVGIEVPRLDADLARRIQGYGQLDEQVKVALRAAELPFRRPEVYRGQLDKSTSVLGYCKALDLFLERELGRRILYPAVARDLYAFQRVVHAAGLADERPSVERVHAFFQIDRRFAGGGLPVHKMALIAQGLLSGRIVPGDPWRILDGLRAWAVILLMFGAELPGGGPRGVGIPALLGLKCRDRGEILDVTDRLFEMQELRNPIAHRQTLLDYAAIDRARAEAEQIFNTLNAML